MHHSFRNIGGIKEIPFSNVVLVRPCLESLDVCSHAWVCSTSTHPPEIRLKHRNKREHEQHSMPSKQLEDMYTCQKNNRASPGAFYRGRLERQLARTSRRMLPPIQYRLRVRTPIASVG